MTNVGQDLLDVPFPDMVKSLAMGIAEAQLELDLKSVQIAQMMAGQAVTEKRVNETTQETEEVTIIEPQKVTFGSRYKATTKGTGKNKRAMTEAELNVDSNVVPAEFSLLELGFTPSFYQFVDTIIEVKMSISMTRESSYSHSSTTTTRSVVGGFFFCGGGARSKCSTVSASYASKFQYHAEGSSLLRTKLVPVPPPSVLEDRIRMLMANNGVYPVGEGASAVKA